MVLNIGSVVVVELWGAALFLCIGRREWYAARVKRAADAPRFEIESINGVKQIRIGGFVAGTRQAH